MMSLIWSLNQKVFIKKYEFFMEFNGKLFLNVDLYDKPGIWYHNLIFTIAVWKR